MLCTTKNHFFKSDGLIINRDKAEIGKLTLIFENVQPEEYAVSILHYANDNHRMDFEANGMPIENYDMSNNPMLIDPPKFDDVKFIVGNEDLKQKLGFNAFWSNLKFLRSIWIIQLIYA
ncbi:DUF2141 domain-containing protein [uncultured Maribacter sp.]|uniref:DUF2141 domain-containing protein n=1 Tax=uncultured Maribacter sp. TaxID=431308 RepID=UPI0030DD42E4